MNKLEELQKVIDSISLASATGSSTFITYLASLLHDKSADLTAALHSKLSEEGIHASSLAFNYFVQSAAHFKHYSFLMQLLYEATVTDIPLDMNTYIKTLSQVYFDHDLVHVDRKNFITYLYTVYSNDHMLEDFTFGCELLQEYIESNFAEF